MQAGPGHGSGKRLRGRSPMVSRGRKRELRAVSLGSDAEFDAAVGYLEDIIMDDEFQLLQTNFIGK